MFDELQGKAVLVTGSSTGIGAAVAKGFARLGAVVAVHYNSSAAAAEAVVAAITAAGGKAVLLHGDVTDSGVARRVVDEAAERCGRLDILVNNAGGMVERRLIAASDDAVLDRVVDLNVRSAIAATAAAIPHFRRLGRATSSMSARSPRATAAAPAPASTPRPRASSRRSPTASPRSTPRTTSASTRSRPASS